MHCHCKLILHKYIKISPWTANIIMHLNRYKD